MRSYSEMYEFTGTVVKVIIGVIIVTGIVLSGVLNKKTIRTNELEDKINKYVYSEGWRETENGKTLQYAINLKYTRFIFDERDIFKTVQQKLNYHNRRVEVRKSNRNNGFVVNPKDVIYDTKLRAILMKDFEYQGVTADRLIILSENVDNQFTRKLESEGIIIPLEDYSKEHKSSSTDGNEITKKVTKKQDLPADKYILLGHSGADELLSIGTEVALKDNRDVKYYNSDFSEMNRASYQGKRVDSRVTRILDYRVTKYGGGARLKEELNFPQGIFAEGSVIYSLRKGYRINVGKRVGDKYECTIPLKKKRSFKILLSREQFKAYDNSNWYLLELPGQSEVGKVWVEGGQLTVVGKNS